MKGRIRVIYVGYHIETLLLLMGDSRFDVTGTGLIHELLSSGTINPVNILFKLIYGLRRRNRHRLLEKALLAVWNLTHGFASSFYYRYRDYLKVLSESGTELVDFSNSHEANDFITSQCVDLMVVCSWSILPEEIVSLPTYGTVNIHPSRLPQYRGALPTLWSLKNADKESAVTYLVMNMDIDAGAIIGQHTFPLSKGDDWYSVEMKINETLQATLLPALWGYVCGEIRPTAQDMREKSSTGKYYDYMRIDWHSENRQDIYNKVNLYPFIVPGDYCHAILDGRKIEIRHADFTDDHLVSPTPGQYHVRGITLRVKAKQGAIACTLFSGLRFKDSILLLLKRKGRFG